MAILTLLFGRDVLGTYEMDQDVMVLGRATDCDVVIDNLNVSRHHTKIEKREGLYYVEDLKSNNGTYLNGTKVTSEILTFGDEIGVGKHTIRFDSHSRLGRGASASIPHAQQQSMGMDESGTVFVTPDEMQKMREKMSAARRAHLRISGVLSNQPTLELASGEVKIGKGGHCDIRIGGFLVGSTHAIVGYRPDGYRLDQIGGLRAMRVNGKRTRTCVLHDGDVIEIAGARLTFHGAQTV